MDSIGIQEFVSGGVGFAVAYILLHWKRADDKAYAESLRQCNDRCAENNEKMITALSGATEAANRVSDALESFVNLKEIIEKMNLIERRLSDGSSEVHRNNDNEA